MNPGPNYWVHLGEEVHSLSELGTLKLIKQSQVWISSHPCSGHVCGYNFYPDPFWKHERVDNIGTPREQEPGRVGRRPYTPLWRKKPQERQRTWGRSKSKAAGTSKQKNEQARSVQVWGPWRWRGNRGRRRSSLCTPGWRQKWFHIPAPLFSVWKQENYLKGRSLLITST